MPFLKRRFGWLPDIPDQRDFQYCKVLPPVRVPPAVDLRKKGFSPVEDQGQLGSCTANALVGNLEYIDLQVDGKYTDQSRLFIYYNERVIENSVSQDSGAMLRDGIKSLVKWGSCPENIWQYDMDKFDDKPSSSAYKSALKGRITVYYRIAYLNEMKSCLASGFPFVFGFSVYESFMSDQVAKTGIANMPGKNERAIGGHAVLAVGYDDKSKRFIVRNSWGSKWGKLGYFTLPYAYLVSRDLSDDFWTIRK